MDEFAKFSYANTELMGFGMFIFSSIQLILVASLPIQDDTGINRRTLWLPPKFPNSGVPFGWFGSALLCPWLVGPHADFSWNRACAGPVPPFRKPKQLEASTSTAPKIWKTLAENYYSEDGFEDSAEDEPGDYNEEDYKEYSSDYK